MSRTRDRLNVDALRGLLGQRPPPRERPQPLLVAAPGAGGGAGLAAWAKTLTLAGTALAVGSAYYHNGTGWAALTPSIGTRRPIAVCIAAVADPAASTLLLAGEWARAGTAGTLLYVGAGGVIGTTFTGNELDETTTAPWVWQLGWQIAADMALILPTDPYRPRRITYCASNGTTQITATVREYPQDPA